MVPAERLNALIPEAPALAAAIEAAVRERLPTVLSGMITPQSGAV